jgi:hypothetical protein
VENDFIISLPLPILQGLAKVAGGIHFLREKTDKIPAYNIGLIVSTFTEIPRAEMTLNSSEGK